MTNAEIALIKYWYEVSFLFQVLLQFSKRQEDVLQTYWMSLVCHAGNVFDTFWVETSSTRYQYVSVSGVASVFQTSGRRFANVLGVSGSSRWTRLQNVLGRNVFHTLSIRVRFRCCFSFPNVRKTFCKRTGRLQFVTLLGWRTRLQDVLGENVFVTSWWRFGV